MKSSFASKNLVAGAVVFGLMAFCAPVAAADLSLPVTGNLLGVVTDAGGTPQMGAKVQLFNKYEQVIANAVTSPDGRFAFAALPIDIYSIRVSLATFLPAARDKIAIKAGVDSLLSIHLATLLSSIEVNYTIPTGAMTDDWKWVLRSSPATRPITRFLPELAADTGTRELKPRVFSGTHAMLSVSGGEGGLVDTESTQADFGTGFALSTSLFGKNQLQVGGTFGQNGTPGPAAMGLCAIYSRSQNSPLAATPEVTLTMSQLGALGPTIPGTQVAGSTTALGNTPIVRTMSLGIYEVADPINGMHLEYGMTGE
ncbi:MAG: carboxypeptidase regulatory-like domain-containing protein, partial [Acidobacteriaceae bacterium]|nr:carboxypeptidase regulatory-like domain-containing protein [Acidobacteriaceae bacterium]